MSVFVTGTDTGVGKTVFSVWLLERLRAEGVVCAGYKPICCGDRDDAMRLLAASSAGLLIDEVNPVWLRAPAAPLTAALEERREIDLAALRAGFVRLRERNGFVVVEGVGGWMVPITNNYFTSDFAAELGLTVMVVAENRLGCLNHILLTLDAIDSAQLCCCAVILNNRGKQDLAASTNAGILRDCISATVIENFSPLSKNLPVELREILSQ